MEVTRRTFLASAAGGTCSVASAAADKIFDGGLAPVTAPGEPPRSVPLLPAGAQTLETFRAKCVGCQLCVTACPQHVLRPSTEPGRCFLPEMTFTDGFCAVACTACGNVCPSGALLPLTPERRKHIHIGEAIFHPENCLAVTEGVNCTACMRHCPVKAIYLVPREASKPNSPQIPVVDRAACIGCGACEHVCPARPLPAMQVNGLRAQREETPMSDADTLAEAKRILRENKAVVVAFRDGVFTAHASGRGIMPLMSLYDDDVSALLGSVIVDKVIGRAAAAICIAAGAKQVHATLMSADAQSFLTDHKIPCSADHVVPQILNREKKGLCPMEQAVKGLTDPLKMIAAIRKKAEQLRSRK